MRRSNFAIALVVFLSLRCSESLIEPVPDHVLTMKGFTYTSFTADGFQQGSERNAVGELKSQINNNWIALTVFEYQSSPASWDIAPNTTGTNPLNGQVWSTTSTEEDIREGARQARTYNMQIMLKPQIDLYTGEWRASITPDAQGVWFRTYAAMMMKYARLASDLHIEMLCIGTEYVVATQPKFSAQWRALIGTLRQIYSGSLTYASNWNGANAYGVVTPEFQQVEFWNELDVIGVDTYFPLTHSSEDSLPDYQTALDRAIRSSQAIGATSFRYGKPVVITEIGIQSVKGALAAPWDYSLGASPGAVIDNTVQEFYYSVMIDALGKQSWCSGMFWWHWESVPSANVAVNYTPEDKPAAQTLHAWYSDTGI